MRPSGSGAAGGEPPEPPSATLVPRDEEEEPPFDASPSTGDRVLARAEDLVAPIVAPIVAASPRPQDVTIRATDPPPEAARSSRAWLLVTPLVLLLLAALALAAFAAFGASEAAEVSAQVEDQQAVLSARMEDELRLRDELAILGADRSGLDAAFAEWARLDQEPERAERALVFLSLAEELMAAHAPLGNTTHEARQVRARVDRLRAARAELLAAREAEAALDGQVAVQLASLLGWVRA